MDGPVIFSFWVFFFLIIFGIFNLWQDPGIFRIASREGFENVNPTPLKRNGCPTKLCRVLKALVRSLVFPCPFKPPSPVRFYTLFSFLSSGTCFAHRHSLGSIQRCIHTTVFFF
jgi:hypothetical protein